MLIPSFGASLVALGLVALGVADRVRRRSLVLLVLVELLLSGLLLQSRRVPRSKL